MNSKSQESQCDNGGDVTETINRFEIVQLGHQFLCSLVLFFIACLFVLFAIFFFELKIANCNPKWGLGNFRNKNDCTDRPRDV